MLNSRSSFFIDCRTALVTGGAGFIGSYLVEQLVNAGIRCSVLDNLFQNSYANIAHLRDSIRFYKADITDREQVNLIFEIEKPEVVFHLAAHHFIPYCDSHPVETIDVNVIGTQRIATACARHGVGRLFYASTAAVYPPNINPHRECDVARPLDSYGMSKYAGELIVEELSRSSSVLVRVGRFFNAVGLRETNPHVIPEIVRQLCESADRKLQLGNITPKRDYIHAGDLASGSIAVALHSSDKAYDVVNIGSGRSLSVKELVDILGKLLGYEIGIETDPTRVRSTDRPVLCANITKIGTEYGWAPRVNIRETLSELAEVIRRSNAGERIHQDVAVLQ